MGLGQVPVMDIVADVIMASKGYALFFILITMLKKNDKIRTKIMFFHQNLALNPNSKNFFLGY